MSHVNINNQWLPYLGGGQDPCGGLEDDLVMSRILDGIRGVAEREEEIEEAESEEGGEPQWNNRGLAPHLKRLQSYLRLRYQLQAEDVVTFLDLATRLLLRDKLPIRAQLKLLGAINMVMRTVKATCLRVEGFSMDARPIFQLMLTKTQGDDETFTTYLHAGHLEGSLRSLFPQSIYYLRHFFTLESVQDLVSGFMADLESTTHYKAFQALACMVLVLPTRLPPDMYDRLLPQWMAIWRKLDNCPEWDLLFLHLFCRARKHAVAFPWEEHMPTFFTYLLSVFSLPLGTGSAPDLRAFPGRYRCLFQPSPIPNNRLLLLSKLVVFFLGRGGGSTGGVDVVLRPHLPNAAMGEESHPVPCSVGARHLILLLASIRTYFHPSNSGRWSEELAVFVSFVATHLSKRVGWEAADRDYGLVPSPQRPLLSDADLDAVVGAVLPLVHQSLYSKSMSAAKHAEQTLKHFACIRPKLVASMTLPVLAMALDPACLTMTHQAPSAMSALSVLVRPLLFPTPYLLQHLPLLLEWSLPGLDSNDPYKTACTMQFYLSVLDWLPIRSDVPVLPYEKATDPEQQHAFRPVRPGGGGEEEEAEAAALWDRAPDMAPVLSDWALAVLDRYLTMLHIKDKPKEASAVKQVVGHMEAGMTSLGKILCRQLFSQMDGPMHAKATARVLAFVKEHTLGGAVVKDVAYVLESCCRQGGEGSRAEVALGQVVPALLQDLKVASASARTLEWRLRLLAGAVRLSGPSVVQWCERLVALVKQVEGHEDKSVRKAGGKLLRRMVQTLVEIFPNTASPQQQQQGAAAPLVLAPPSQKTLNLSWYIPGAREVEAAVSVLEALVEPAFAALGPIPQGEISTAQKGEMENQWRRALKTILNGLRAANSLLVDLPGPASDDQVLRVGTSLLLSSCSASASAFIHQLRARLATSLHSLLPSLTSEASPLHRDVKALKTWVKAAREVLTSRGSYQSRRAKLASSYMMYTKAMSRNWVTEAYRRASRAHEAAGGALQSGGPGAYAAPDYPRNLLISRVYCQHLLRCEEAAYMVPRWVHNNNSSNSPSSPSEEACRLLLSDLVELSAYDISTVRQVAQEAVGQCGPIYPWLLKAHLPGLIRCLTLGTEDDTPARIHERATAATFLLRQRATMRMVSSSWPLQVDLIRAMASSAKMVASLPVDKQETLAERLSRVTLAYLEVWFAADIKSDRRKKDWQALVDGLLAMINTNNNSPLPSPSSSEASARPGAALVVLHWRYRLLIQWLLLHLSRPDAPRPPALWTSLIEGLRSGDGQPLQKLSLAGLARLLTQEVPPPAGPNSLLPGPREGEEGVVDGDYVVLTEDLPPATRDDDDVMVVVGDEGGAAVQQQQQQQQQLSQAFLTNDDGPAMLKTLCLALAHNHREDGAQWSTGVEDLIKDAWRRRGANLPDTRLSLTSFKFQATHAHLVRLLLRALGPRLLLPLNAAAESILEEGSMPTESEAAYYGTVAEVLAGLMSEYTRTEVPEARRAAMWAAVLPVLQRVVPRLSLDYSLDWADAIRLASMHRTPEAFYPLHSLLVAKVVSSLGGVAPGSPPVASVTVRDDYTAQAKWLRMLQPLLIEFLGEPATRARAQQAVVGQVLPVLLSNLGHPYKICRTEIARTLFLIYGYGATPLQGPHTGGVDTVEHVRAVALLEGGGEAVKGLVASTATQLSIMDDDQGGTAGAAAPVEGEGEEASSSQEMTRRKETVLQWILLSVASGNHVDYAASYVLPLLPVVYECVRDKDLELSALGKHAVRSLARALWFKERLVPSSATADTVSPSSWSSAGISDEGDEEDKAAAGQGGEDVLSGLLQSLLSLSKHRSWYVKLETAQGLALLQVQHALLLRPEESRRVTERLVELLGDERKEVQDTARLALSAVLSAAEMGPVQRLAQSYCQAGLESVGSSKRRKDNKGGRAKTTSTGVTAEGGEEVTGDNTKSKGSSSSNDPSSMARAQLRNTLVLASLVLAYPYEVPPYLPRCLTVLARLFSGPPVLQAIIKKTFTDFKRTHQDEWESNHRLRFTPDELDALSDVLVSPHYYA